MGRYSESLADGEPCSGNPVIFRTYKSAMFAEFPHTNTESIHVLRASANHKYGDTAAVCPSAIHQYSRLILDISKIAIQARSLDDLAG